MKIQTAVFVMMLIVFPLMGGCATVSSKSPAEMSDDALCFYYSATSDPAALAEMEHRQMDQHGSSFFKLFDAGTFVAMSQHKVFVGEWEPGMMCTGLGILESQQTISDADGNVQIFDFISTDPSSNVRTYTEVWVRKMHVTQVSQSTD